MNTTTMNTTTMNTTTMNMTMNKLKTLLTVCARVMSGAAVAALDLQVEVVELSGAEFKAPANEAARVRLDSCTTCARQEVRVSKATIYRVGGVDADPVTLQEFRNAAKKVAGNERALVYLSYDAATGRVTEIVLQDTE